MHQLVHANWHLSVPTHAPPQPSARFAKRLGVVYANSLHKQTLPNSYYPAPQTLNLKHDQDAEQPGTDANHLKPFLHRL